VDFAEMKARPFNPSKWDSYYDEIVEGKIHLKFGQNPTLKDVLLSTCSKMAVDASPSDCI
jgi:predicted NAD-dependent protein-ADP-ribosyltransferase YbiA (DUF1768 family)